MRPLLTYLVPVYWMAAFALMASQAASQPSGIELFVSGGADTILLESGSAIGQGVATAFSIAFGVVATLFLWAFLTAVLGPGDYPGGYEEVASMAFGGATLLVTVSLVVSAARGGIGVQGDGAFQLAALAASYVAVIAERRVLVAAPTPRESDHVREAARHMALGAAHSTMLTRLVGGNGPQGGAD